jgi:hypothetical protein
MILRNLTRYTLVTAVVVMSALILSDGMGAQNSGTLSGTLLDPQGTAVPNASLELRRNYLNNEMHWNGGSPGKQKPPHEKLLRVNTNNSGQFSIKLTPGNWDVFAYFDGFAPTCTVIVIEPGKTATLELRFPRYAATSVQ